MPTKPDGQTLSTADVFELLEAERERLTLPVLQDLERTGQPVSCRVGCSACCRQLVVVSPLEAIALGEHVRRLLPAVRRKIEEGHRRHAQALARRPTLTRQLGRFRAALGYLETAEADALESAYWAAQLACPFLIHDRCAIYPARPFACREHLALSPPELCARDPNTVVTAPTRFQFRAVASAVGERAFQAEDRLIPIHEALAYAESHKALSRATAPAAAVQTLVRSAVQRVRQFFASL